MSRRMSCRHFAADLEDQQATRKSQGLVRSPAVTNLGHAKRGWFLALILVIVGSAAFADEATSVAVQTETARQGAEPDLVTAYGSAVPALDGGMTLSLQQDGRVLALAVTPGETVHAGQRLLDFSASAAAIANYQQALSALTAARQQRDHVAQLLRQQLATRDQLAQANKAVADAAAALEALRRDGADQPSRTLTAPFDGIIANIPVAQGARVQPGTILMTITRLDGLVVTVGIDPSVRARVQPGQTVHLVPLSGGPRLDGQILRVDGTLNPRTRFVDADVSVPPGSVLSGEAFLAEIKVGDLHGWIVQHDAVLIDPNGAHLFQVAGTKAKRVDIKVIGTAGANDVVQGTLDPNRPIVVQGNYQLTDGATVRRDTQPADGKVASQTGGNAR